MSDREALFRQIILDHARERCGGDLPESATAAPPGLPGVGQSYQLNPVCGDEITVRVTIAGGVVSGVHWNGAGCTISMASASVLAELAEGLEPARLRTVMEKFRQLMRSGGRGDADPDETVLGDAVVFAGAARFPARVKCALLAWLAAEDALEQAAGTA